MAIDLYTKAILTVIAISLAAIAFGPTLHNATAAQTVTCGNAPQSPCFAKLVNGSMGDYREEND